MFALDASACGDDTEADLSGPDVEAPAPPDWRAMAVPTSAQLLGVWGRDAAEAYAVGWEGTVLRWDGQVWIEETTPTSEPLTEVSGVPTDPDNPAVGGPVFAVGWSGTLLVRENDGVWRDVPQTTTSTVDLLGVHIAAPDQGLAVGDQGTVLAWDGEVWSEVDFAVPSEFSGELVRPRTALFGVRSAQGDRWVISGAGGASYRSSGGTARFESLDTRESLPLRGVWGPARGTVYTVGLQGVVLRLTNQWRRDGDGLPDAFLFGVWGQDESDVTVVGWGGTILRRQDGGWQEETVERDVDLRDVWVDAATGRAFAVGARGTILTRTATVSAP